MLEGKPIEVDVAVVGQIARDLALRVDEVPGAGATATVRERVEVLGGTGANQAVALSQLGCRAALVGVVGDDRHGAALVGTAGVSAADFAERAASWVTAMTAGLPYDAGFIDAGDYTTADEQTIAFNKSALDMIVQVSREEGIGVDVVAPLQELLARQVAEGHGAASFARMFEGIRQPAVSADR